MMNRSARIRAALDYEQPGPATIGPLARHSFFYKAAMAGKKQTCEAFHQLNVGVRQYIVANSPSISIEIPLCAETKQPCVSFSLACLPISLDDSRHGQIADLESGTSRLGVRNHAGVNLVHHGKIIDVYKPRSSRVSLLHTCSSSIKSKLTLQ
jgi:hypothetical protein